jgi:hypothetical protein
MSALLVCRQGSNLFRRFWSGSLIGFSLLVSWGADALAASSPELPVVETVEQWCGLLARDLRSVNREHCLSYPWKSDATSNGQIVIPHCYWGAENGRRIIILGGIHGDEISSVSLVFRWLDFLEKSPADSDLRKMRFMFMPLLNPDGYFSRPRTRTNLSGVDLNRNFKTKDWDELALSYWVKKTKKDKRRFPGHTAASEVETRYFQDVMNAYKPEMIISIHAPYGILDHDGDVRFPKNLKSPLPLKALGSFPGSLGRYAGVERNVPVITVELMEATKMPSAKAIEELLHFVLNSKPDSAIRVVR